MKTMTVKEVVDKLKEFPENLPVRFLTYGCGHYSYLEVTPDLFSHQVDDTPQNIVQIQADWN